MYKLRNIKSFISKALAKTKVCWKELFLFAAKRLVILTPSGVAEVVEQLVSAFSLIIEGSTENVLQYIMPLKSIYNIKPRFR